MRTIAITVSIIAAAAAAWVAARRTRTVGWTSDFDVDPGDLATTGSNPWFPLVPGHVLTLEDGDTRLVISVLDDTLGIEGITTRVVEERESEDGALVEISRNYFAASRLTNSVYYFGEDVDIYEDGRITSHEGSWRAGRDGARPGLMMPGTPLLGARYFQEIAPGIAMDRAEIVSLDDRIAGASAVFDRVLRIAESSPLEPGIREFKTYAAGVGLVRDGSLRLSDVRRPAAR